MIQLKDYSLLFILCLFALPVSAQHKISGYIYDEETSLPVENARIYNNDAGKSYFSNEKGYFEITNLSNGTYSLFIYLFGYEVVKQDITILDDDTEVEITLEQISREFTELTITEQRENTFAIKRLREVEETAIYAGKKNEVVLLDEMIINTASNNARQIYSQVSGLNIYESNDAGLQLNIGGRGLDPNRSSHFNTRQNGYDISADVLGYPESYYTPPAEALDEIQVIRGAASLQYGTQFGGLVNFKMKSPNRTDNLAWTSRQTTGSDNLFTSFNSLSGSTGKLGYYGYYNYKQGNGSRPNSTYDSKNIYTHLDYQFGEMTSLGIEFSWLNYLAHSLEDLLMPSFTKIQ